MHLMAILPSKIVDMRHAGSNTVLLVVALTAFLSLLRSPHEPASKYTSLLDNIWRVGKLGSNVSARVSLPHSFNAIDGQRGGPYARAPHVYSAEIHVPRDGRVHILDCGAASMAAEFIVNGVSIGSHRGGFSRFRFDATNAIRDGTNSLQVIVDNSVNLTDILPRSGDFTVFGGLFRDLGVISIRRNTPVLHPFDLASPAVKIMQTNAISRELLELAQFNTSILLSCFGKLEVQKVTLQIQITDHKSHKVAYKTLSVNMNTDCATPTKTWIPFTIQKPRLWDGRVDPYMYFARLSVIYQNIVVDTYSARLGVRTYFLDSEQGFYLNGREYPLDGVNLHQDWQDKGWGISANHTRRNFEIMDELNMTALRCAHYQHSDYTYRLADHYGFVVWAEIPNLDLSPRDHALHANAATQLRELIRQSYNHPAIVFWSVANELGGDVDNDPVSLVQELHTIAKEEDPYRYTVIAISPRKNLSDPLPQSVDAVAINAYHGWYTWFGPHPNNTGPDMDRYHATSPQTPFGIAEFGAGSSIHFHSENPVRMDHTEEYQSWLHEQTWAQLRARRWIWWKTVWNFADFASDKKAEGDTGGRNDKGLVTYDRSVRKDAFYYYKAIWNSEPFVHLCSGRFFVRETKVIAVKAYAAGVRFLVLYVNGAQVAEPMALREDRIHVWDGVVLAEGQNYVEVLTNDEAVFSRVTWTYYDSNRLEIPSSLSLQN
ncbi:glycoside hydrolase superfamily [Chytriomyces sp. MP71]|nr:glycoside hydrolase superfamily [Chytriomyces sp. MP71]